MSNYYCDESIVADATLADWIGVLTGAQSHYPNANIDLISYDALDNTFVLHINTGLTMKFVQNAVNEKLEAEQ